MSKDYTIYCTEEQTKRALELGAPIKTRAYRFDDHSKDFFAEKGKGYFIPTAEWMRGWLEEQFFNEISIYRNSLDSSLWEFEIFDKEDKQCFGNGEFLSSRPEATLAAIDAALEHLSKNKI